MVGAVRLWPESIPFPAAIGEHVRALIIEDMERLEHACGDAMRLTHPKYWDRLIIVDQDVPLGAPRIPRTVACMLP